jgi:rRNA processing protein Krr1/Pno1
MKALNDQPKTLQLSKTWKEQELANEQATVMDKLDSRESNIMVSVPVVDDDKSDDAGQLQKRNDWLKAIHKDIYITEAVNILKDWSAKK